MALMAKTCSKNGLKFRRLHSDNGREYKNKSVRDWCADRKIEHTQSPPYYHQGNGRVERVIRTIRVRIKKNKGIIVHRLTKIVEVYNDNYHRGIGMSPKEAFKSVNHNKVKKWGYKHAKEFSSRNMDKLSVGTKVILRNENRRTKMDKEYGQLGEILKSCNNYVYIIAIKDGKNVERHQTQFKTWPGNVGDDAIT